MWKWKKNNIEINFIFDSNAFNNNALKSLENSTHLNIGDFLKIFNWMVKSIIDKVFILLTVYSPIGIWHETLFYDYIVYVILLDIIYKINIIFIVFYLFNLSSR